MKLPKIYALPKQHKTPVKFRFIDAGVKFTTKTLSKIISSALKHILKTVKNYYNYEYFFKKGSPFWVIDNRSKVIHDIKMINNRRKAKTVASYDFTTLYTSIPHSKLLESLKFVCHDSFKCSKKLFLIANKNRAYWSDKSVNSKKSISFTADLLLQWITFLVNNSYVTFGSSFTGGL